jgi:hypothetical protein
MQIHELALIRVSAESMSAWRASISACSASVFTAAVTNAPRWHPTLIKSRS